MSETLFSKLSNGLSVDETFPSNTAPVSKITTQLSNSCSTTSGRILLLAEKSKTKKDLIKNVANLSRDVLEDSFLWYLESDPQSGMRALALTSTDQTALWQVVADDVSELLKLSHDPGKVVRSNVSTNQTSLLMATFLQSGDHPEAIIALVPQKETPISQTESFLAEFALCVNSFNTSQANKNLVQQAGFYQKLIQLSNIVATVFES